MNGKLKTTLIAIAAIIIGSGAFTYGALTAKPATHLTKPSHSQAPTPTKAELAQQLQSEQATIISVLLASYPKINTNYTVATGQLFDRGQWYGTTLTYHGTDSLNRDTLRVLMQKKQGVWVLRTTPPQIMLSTVEFPDVPKSILDTINQPVSLPASNDNSPTVTVGG